MGDSQQTVFISYGHDEYAVLARHLKEDLEGAGFQVWMDEEGIQHTHDWELSIETGLKASQWVIACLTPHAIRRPDGVCLDELATARFSGKSIAPIMVNMVEPPLSICRIQWLDMQSCLTLEDDQYVLNEDTYQEQLKLLLATLRGEHRLDTEGGLAALRSTLRPFDYGVEIDQHISSFFGREWLFEAFDDWLLDEKGSDVFWIQGGVGIGKTALAAMLAHKRREVAGVHFCKASDSERSNPVRILCSLAYQLSTQIPAYHDALLSNPELNHLYEQNATAVFDVLFTNTMRREWVKDGVKVLIIDALDETMVGGSKGSLAEVLGRDLIGRIPPWLKLVITSRSNNDLTRELSAFDPLVFSAEDQRNRDDLLGFAIRETEKRLTQPNTQTDADACKTIAQSLADKSEGCFLYLTMVFAESDKGRLDLTKPDTFPKGLTGLYKHFFDRRFPDPGAYKAHQRPLLELLVASSRPLPVRLAEAVLDWDDYDADDALEPLGALFPVKKDKGGEETLEPFHRSIVEWLQDRQLSGREYRVSATKGHERFVEHLYPAFESWQQQGKNDDSGWFFSFLAESLASLEQWGPLKAVISNIHAPSVVVDVILWAWWRSVGRDSARSMAGEAYRGIKDSDLANDAGGFLCFIGNYNIAEELGFYVLKMRRVQFDDNQPPEAISLDNHIIFSLHRSPEAISLDNLLSSLQGLAFTLSEQGKYDKAEALFREALGISRKYMHWSENTIQYNLDILQTSRTYAKEETLHRESLKINRELFGDKHLDVVTSLNKLAYALHKKPFSLSLSGRNRCDEVTGLCRKSLKISRELLGENHPDVLSTMNDLADALMSKGVFDDESLEEAETLFNEVNRLRRETMKPDEAQFFRGMIGLLRVMTMHGNLDAAVEYGKTLLQEVNSALGDHHDEATEIDDILFHIIYES